MNAVVEGSWSPDCNDVEKAWLLRLAHETIVAGCEGTPPSPDVLTLPDVLRRPAATFVTLKKNDRLRGCMGTLDADSPLAMSVYENALNAAFRDPRFPPVRSSECPQLCITISILSPLVNIDGPTSFIPGTHGIVLYKHGHRAVFLPEVASEQGWGHEETLTALAQKAGLPGNAWKKDASFSVFTSCLLEC